MADEPSSTTRTYIAVATAAATSTLAVGLTLAALGGYLRPSPGREPPDPAPASSTPHGPTAPAEREVVLVPIEPTEPASASVASIDSASGSESAYFDSDEPDDDESEHEHRDHDEDDDDD